MPVLVSTILFTVSKSYGGNKLKLVPVSTIKNFVPTEIAVLPSIGLSKPKVQYYVFARSCHITGSTPLPSTWYPPIVTELVSLSLPIEKAKTLASI